MNVAAKMNLQITLCNGQPIYFEVNDNLKASVEGENLIFTDGDSAIPLRINDVRHFKYVDLSTSGLAESAALTIKVAYNGESLSIIGSKPGDKFKIYNLSGMVIIDTESNVIPLNGLLPGTYILTVGNLFNFKFSTF